MNKAQLIDRLAELSGLSKAESGRVLELVEKIVIDEVAAGGKVKLSGFAAFESVEKDARVARNPRTGEKIDVPAKRVPKIRPLTDFVNAVAK